MKKLLKIFTKSVLVVSCLVFVSLTAGRVEAVGGVIGRVSVVDDLGNNYGANNVTVNIHQSSGPDANMTTANSPANGQVVYSRYSDNGVCQDVSYQVGANAQGYYNFPGGAWECLSSDPRGLECSDENKFLKVSGIGDTGLQWNGRPGYWSVDSSSIAGTGNGQSGIAYFGTCDQVPDYKRNTCNSACGGNPTCVMMGQHDNAWAGRVDYQYHLYTVRLSNNGTTCNGSDKAQVSLHWQTNYDFASLRLYRYDSNDQNGVLVANLPTTRSGDYVVDNLDVNNTYNFYINAIASNGQQTWSNPPYDSPIRVSTPSSCQGPPKISLYAQQADIEDFWQDMISYKPGKNGYNVLKDQPLKVGNRIPDAVFDNNNWLNNTNMRIWVSRFDGAKFDSTNGELCPTGKEETFFISGKTVYACNLFDGKPTYSSGTSGLLVKGWEFFGGWTPKQVNDYYVWIEARDEVTGQMCSGALQYYPQLNLNTPVTINGTNVYWCGQGSLQVFSTFETTGMNVRPKPGVTQRGEFGISGGGEEFFNPIRVTPQIDFSNYFETSSIGVYGIAFVNPNSGLRDGVLSRMVADVGDKGFILLYAPIEFRVITNDKLTILQQGKYYLYYNGTWNEVPVYAASAPITRPLDVGDLSVYAIDNPLNRFESVYEVKFSPSMGSKSWRVYDFAQTDQGGGVSFERKCTPGANGCK